jgi:hypothetical protein
MDVLISWRRTLDVTSLGAVSCFKVEWIYGVSGSIVMDISMILIVNDGE